MFETVLDSIQRLTRGLTSRLTLAAALWLLVGISLSAGVVWAFGELAEGVLEGETQTFDEAVLLWIESSTPRSLDGAMRFITALGYYRVVGAMLLVATAFFLWRGWRFSAILLAVSTLGGVLLTTVLKYTFQRARPDFIDSGYSAGSFAFPSGHATVAVGFYGALTLILAYHLRGFSRWVAVVLGVLLILLIGFSRLYLGVHYPSDVLAGYLAAPLWLVFVGAAYAAWISIKGLRAAEFRR